MQRTCVFISNILFYILESFLYFDVISIVRDTRRDSCTRPLVQGKHVFTQQMCIEFAYECRELCTTPSVEAVCTPVNEVCRTISSVKTAASGTFIVTIQLFICNTYLISKSNMMSIHLNCFIESVRECVYVCMCVCFYFLEYKQYNLDITNERQMCIRDRNSIVKIY